MRIRLNSNALVQFPRIAADCVDTESAKVATCWWGDAAFAHRMRLLPQSIAAALYRDPTTLAAANCRKSSRIARMEKPTFRPKKVLILSKITRYEFEKRLHSNVDDKQLEALLRRRGSDYHQLLAKHRVHHDYLTTIQSELEEAGVESRVVQRSDYNEEALQWADAIMTAGGDGTFLLAASRIHQKDKPVIGINTDPQGSEGYMCLMRKLPKEHFRSALQRLLDGDFDWLYRQRIRITLSGDAQNGVGDSIDLHDRQLNQEPSTTRKRPRSPSERVTVQLPVLALNEVFIGESLSSRVSYYEIQIDDGKMVKQKSSGIAMCTGTGSTSWYFNINKLTEQCVSELLRIVSDRCEVSLPVDDKKVVSDICTTFNQQLIFSPDLRRMAFTVRDPIFNATFPPITPRGFAEKIVVKSRGYDAHLVVDGGVSYRFNDGAEASLEVHEEDALQTVIFRKKTDQKQPRLSKTTDADPFARYSMMLADQLVEE
ncbi:hypothetical protein ANCCEY_01143 [Ancylostoma ceylanicum]|uniref:NAD(+) kinase n=1 Tax=Ancylostoma ceylanicum TaxID=53326 RepID=A0A0D6M6L5_9BILA|nr:hypothetical protein ANCCEY_01143 [Ancylostoma ceylanicum]